jgi:glutamyl-tRNA reductase
MIICISASHKTAKLPLLEALNVPDPDQFLKGLHDSNFVDECILIQTCHRVEIFIVNMDPNHTEVTKQTLMLWSANTGVSVDLITAAVQEFQGKEALSHLFYLVAGLESIIIGEYQVLGQVRDAWINAKKLGTTGTILNRVFRKALNTGRKTRTETKISEGCMSISSAAVDLAELELGNLDLKRALIIGAGEAGSLVAETLKSKSSTSILVANRTYEKGYALAQRVSGEAIPFKRVNSMIPSVDFIITAVSVAKPIITKSHFDSFDCNLKPSKKLLLIDISHPHAIQQEVGLIKGVRLKTIDDLKEIVSENMQRRENEATKCRTIISAELNRFETELAELIVQPLITEIYRKFDKIRERELQRAIRKMHETDKKKLIVIDRFSRELIERIIQIPVEQLRKAALTKNGNLISTTAELFQTKPVENITENNS